MNIEDVSIAHVNWLDPKQLTKTIGSDLTVVARLGENAADVAARCAERRAELVVVTTEGGRPMGVIAPDSFADEVSKLGRQANDFSEAVQILEDRPADELQEILGNLTTRYRPPIFWCERGQHHTSYDPCRVHGR